MRLLRVPDMQRTFLWRFSWLPTGLCLELWLCQRKHKLHSVSPKAIWVWSENLQQTQRFGNWQHYLEVHVLLLRSHLLVQYGHSSPLWRLQKTLRIQTLVFPVHGRGLVPPRPTSPKGWKYESIPFGVWLLQKWVGRCARFKHWSDGCRAHETAAQLNNELDQRPCLYSETQGIVKHQLQQGSREGLKARLAEATDGSESSPSETFSAAQTV